MAGSVKFIGFDEHESNALNVTTPSGTTGDTLVMTLASYDTSGVDTPPWATGNAAFTTDFTRAGSVARTSTGTTGEIWSRITDGTEDATYEPAVQGGTYGEFAGLIRLSASQLQTTGGGFYSYSTGHRIPAHTVDTDGSMAVIAFCGYNTAVNHTTMTNNGWTRHVNLDSSYYSVYTKNVDAGTYSEVNVTTDIEAVSVLAIFEPVPAPNVIATDDFNRANGALGSNWTNGQDTLVGAVDTNQMSLPAGEYGAIQWAGAGTFANDQWAELTLTFDGTNMIAGPSVRGTTGSNYYAAKWDYDGGAGKYEIVGYGFSLASKTGVGVTGTRTFRIEAVGNQITMYVDGVEELTTTDSNLTSGKPGVSANVFYTTSDILADNFSAGDWTAPASNVTINPVGSTSSSSSDTAQLTPVFPAGPAVWESQASKNGEYNSNCPIDKPTGTVEGDLLVAFITTFDGSVAPIVTPPSGWTLVESFQQNSGNSGSARVYWKVASASEGASYLWTVQDNSYYFAGTIWRVSNADTTTPIQAVTTRAGSAATPATDEVNAQPAAPAIMVTDDTLLLAGLSAYTSTPGAGTINNWTKVANYDSTYSGAFIRTVGTGGAQAAANNTTGTDNNSVSVTIAINPASAPNEKATDDFNRANGGLGANWATAAGLSAPSIVSNTASVTTNGGYGAYWSTEELTPDNLWVEVAVTATDDTAYQVAGPMLYAPSRNIRAVWRPDLDQYWLENQSYTQYGLKSAPAWSGPSDTRVLRLEMVGDVFTLYVDGVEEITQTIVPDVDLTYGGIYIDDYNSAGRLSLDNFSAGDWTAPTSDPITDYLIEYRTTSGPGAWTPFSDGVSALTGATVTGLTPGLSYDFRVSAVNSAGAGAWSNIATVVASSSGTVYLKLGDSGVSSMKLGDVAVSAAYLGDVQLV